MKEGVIKYRLYHISGDYTPAPDPVFFRMRRWLYSRGWIGCTPEGIGYGNWSMRTPQPYVPGDGAFHITASRTGHLERMDATHVALVTFYCIEENYLYCRGRHPASSEALSHAALYAAMPAIGCVAHIHHAAAWEALKGKAPTTDPTAAYGTPQMARAIQEVASDAGFLVMGGHPEGLLFWADSPETLRQRMTRVMRPFS